MQATKEQRTRNRKTAVRLFFLSKAVVFFLIFFIPFSVRGNETSLFDSFSTRITAWERRWEQEPHDTCIGQKKSFVQAPLFEPEFSWKRGRSRTWVRGFGNWTKVGGTRNSYDLQSYSYGMSFGVDRQFGRHFLMGLSAGGNRSKLKRKIMDSEAISAVHASFYLRKTLQRFYFDIETGVGYDDVSYLSKSPIQWNVDGEAGTWWEHGLGKAEPFLGLRHVGLDGDANSESKTTFLAGMRYSWKTTGVYAVTSPRFYVGLLQELGDRGLMNVGTFVDAPTVYYVPGYEIAETRLFCGGGFTSSMGTSLDLYLRYTAEVASGYSSHTMLIGMNWNF